LEANHLALCQPWLVGPLGASISDGEHPGSSLLAATTLKPSCSAHAGASIQQGSIRPSSEMGVAWHCCLAAQLCTAVIKSADMRSCTALRRIQIAASLMG
jgi:hypothetical protein